MNPWYTIIDDLSTVFAFIKIFLGASEVRSRVMLRYIAANSLPMVRIKDEVGKEQHWRTRSGSQTTIDLCLTSQNLQAELGVGIHFFTNPLPDAAMFPKRDRIASGVTTGQKRRNVWRCQHSSTKWENGSLIFWAYTKMVGGGGVGAWGARLLWSFFLLPSPMYRA